MRPVQQIFGGQAFEQDGCRCLGIDRIRHRHDVIGGSVPQGRIGAGHAVGIGDLVAGQQVVHLRTDIDYRAGGFHAYRRGWRDHPVFALADIDVDVVNADGGLADAHLVRGPAREPGCFHRIGSGCRRSFSAHPPGRSSRRRARRPGQRCGRGRHPAAADGGAGRRNPLRRRLSPTISASSRSRPGGVSKVDCQCQKVRLPSVTGLSCSVAT